MARGFFHKLFIGNHDGTYISENYRKVIIVNFMGILAGLITFCFGIEAITREAYSFSIFLFIIFAFCTFVFIHLRITRNVKFATISAAAIMFICNSYLLLIVAQTDSTAPLWHYFFPSLVLFATNRKVATIITALLTIETVLAFHFIPALHDNYTAFYLSRFYAIFAAITGLAFLYEYVREKTHDALEKANKEKTGLLARVYQQKEEIQAQADQLAETNEMLGRTNSLLTNSIRYAKNIQESILPDLNNFKTHFPESFILFKPRDIVSGDFYWFSDQCEIQFVAAVDCTGHGVPGAFMSMIGNTLLNEIVNAKKIFDPGKILDHLNQGVKYALTQKGGEDHQDDGMVISICRFDKQKKEICIAGACQNAFIICEKDGKKEPLRIIEGSVYSIGEQLKPSNAQYFSDTINDKDKMTIYLCSDGFQDQFGGMEDRKFMVSRFKQMLEENYNLSMEEQKKNLIATFESWRGFTEQIDDVLVIGIRY